MDECSFNVNSGNQYYGSAEIGSRALHISKHNVGPNYTLFLGGLSLHLNHLIASRMTIYDWPFGTLPFRLFGSDLDTRDLETYPRT